MGFSSKCSDCEVQLTAEKLMGILGNSTFESSNSRIGRVAVPFPKARMSHHQAIIRASGVSRASEPEENQFGLEKKANSSHQYLLV